MKSLFHLLSILLICALSQAYVITFDDLPLDEIYDAGDSPIYSNGVQINLTGDGTVTVQDDLNANGLNYELWISNIDLDFNFDILPLQGLSLQYGYLGGNNTLEINNIEQSFGDFTTLHGMNFNGATVLVIGTQELGAINVIGPISSFGISGQELAIDNVIACIPEPATLGFLGLGALVLRGRRK